MVTRVPKGKKHKPPAPHRSPEISKSLSFSVLLPRLPHPSFGREKEIISFTKAFPDKSVFCIQGMPGIGKSFLMLELAQQINKCIEPFHGRTFFLEVKEGWHSQTLIERIFACLERIGVKIPPDTVSTAFEPVQEKLANLINLLNAEKLALFIDDFHFLPLESRLELLQFFLRYLRNSKVVISSCISLDLPPLKQLEVWQKNLTELDAEPSRSLFQEFLEEAESDLVSSHDLEMIFSRIGGHPFTIKLLASFFLSSRQKVKNLLLLSSSYSREVKSFLMKRIFCQISEPERRCLALFVTSQFAVSPALLQKMGKHDNLEEVVDKLRRKLLIDVDSEGLFGLHSIIRGFGRNVLEEDILLEHHTLWANFFRRQISKIKDRPAGELLLEYVYHLLMAGNTAEGSRELENYLIDIYLQGKFDRLMSLIQLAEDCDLELSPGVLITKGKILYLWGKWEESLEIFEYLRGHSDAKLLPKIFNCLGHIQYCRNDLDTAISYYRRSLKIAEDLSSQTDIAETYCFLGDAFYSKRLSQKALDFFEKGLKVWREIEDIEGMTDAMIKKAQILAELGDFSQAKKILRDSLKAFSRQKNILGEGEVQLFLAQVAFREGKFQETLDYIEKSQAIFEKQRNVLKSLSLAVLKGKSLFFLKEIDRAFGLLSESDKTATLYEHWDIAAECAFYLGRIHLERRDFNAVIERSGTFSNLYNPLLGANLELLACVAHFYAKQASSAFQASKNALDLLEGMENRPIYNIAQAFHFSVNSYFKMSQPIDVPELSMRELTNPACSEDTEMAVYLSVLQGQNPEHPRKVLMQRGIFWYSQKDLENLKQQSLFDIFFDPAEGFVILADSRKISLKDKPRLKKLLFTLMNVPGKLWSPAELYQMVWEQEFDWEENYSNFRSHISRLRKVVEPLSSTREFFFILKSQENSSYYFNSQVNFCLVLEPESPAAEA